MEGTVAGGTVAAGPLFERSSNEITVEIKRLIKKLEVD